MTPSRESGTLGTYQRYKLGQAQFQKWLKQTSDRLQFSESAELASREKLAAMKSSDPAARGSHDVQAASSVHWSQLETMANVIVDNLDPGQIPQSAISILRDVVHLRKKSARFFGSAAAKSDNNTLKEKNSAHEHIIKVLEKILHKFEVALSRIRSSPPASSASQDGQLGMNDINNMFEYLKVEESHDAESGDVEEVSELEVATPKRSKNSQKKGGKKQKQKKPPKVQRLQKQTTKPQDASWVDNFQWVDGGEGEDDEDDDFDYYMLIYCFFQDFNSIRTYIGDRWTEYFYHKSASLDTLAVLTNAACEIFHEMEYELGKALEDTPRLAEYDFMMETLFYNYGLDHVDYSGEDQLTDRERKYKILGEADWLGFPAYSHVLHVLEAIPPRKVPLFPASATKRPSYGVHDFEGFQKFTRDVIFELAIECCHTKAMKTNGELPMVAIAQDELTLDFEDILRIRGYTSAMIFDLSLYTDVRYILEEQVVDAFDLLQRTAASMKTTLEEQLPNIRGPWDLKKECRERITEIETYVLKDLVENDKARRFQEKGMTEPFERDILLKSDPVWSGLLDFRCRLVLNDLGSRFIAESSVVFGAAFLYVASRLDAISAGGLQWPQLDRFLRVYGEEKVLQGAIIPGLMPTNLLKRFVDISAADSSFNKALSPSRSLEAFYERYAKQHGYSRQPLAYLREIIRDRLHHQAGILSSGATGDKSSLDTKSTNMKRTSLNLSVVQAAQREARQSASVSPVRLLEILDESTTSLLETQLSIDYFKLHKECVQLLRELLVEFSPQAEKDVPSLFEENIRVSELTLLIPVIYRLMRDGNAAEVTKRLGNVVTAFCSRLSRSDAGLVDRLH
ncbi:hypothetical protein F5Y05DRAFT_237750 [Hypoxylon sp. FL0543]|nr:hypothetical protein F5Y05DRAFT_237750 [Hypoxylon sp. FL0543]